MDNDNTLKFDIRDEREFLTSVAMNLSIDAGERPSLQEAQLPRFSIVDTHVPLPVSRSLHIGPAALSAEELQVVQFPGNTFSAEEVIAALTQLVQQHASLPVTTFIPRDTNGNTVLVGKKIVYDRDRRQLEILDI